MYREILPAERTTVETVRGGAQPIATATATATLAPGAPRVMLIIFSRAAATKSGTAQQTNSRRY